MTPNRRILLALAGTSVSMGLAGCLGSPWILGDNVECKPVDDYETLGAYPTMDEPPHTVPGSNGDQYLGTCVADEPSLEFDSFDDHGIPLQLDSENVDAVMTFEEAGFWAGLARNREEVEHLLDLKDANRDLREELNEIDFVETALVAGQYGVTSSNYAPRWARVEEREGALHLHGYILDPGEVNDDAAYHRFLLAVHHRGSIPNYVMVSLTIDEDTRVNFSSEEGIVQIPRSIGYE